MTAQGSNFAVLSIPGRDHENRYFKLAIEGLEQAGASVVDPRLANVAGFRYDILHLNFPTHYVTENGWFKATLLAAAMAAYLLLARLLGRRIVYTVHDVVPVRPNNEFVLWRFLDLVHALTQGYVFISRSSRQAFVERFPGERGKPWILVRHGAYPASVLDAAARAARRRDLAGEADVFLVGFVGALKPYKNPRALQALPARLADGRPVRVVVAGHIPEPQHRAEIEAALAAIPEENLIRLDRQLTDSELDAVIQAVDVVLLPYARGSNSGVALLVLANHGRLIGSAAPMFAELAEDLGAPWVYTASGAPEALAQAVASVASRRVDAADRARLRSYLDQIDFAAGGRAVHGFCRDLLRAAQQPAVAAAAGSDHG
jgi:glycosyltransferase involved in cell wall biosynthesis